jgi:hypothetical protein
VVTVEELVFQRAGLMRGGPLALALSSWILVARKLGKFPTVVEVAEVMGKGERTAWRWRARIRRVFDEDEFRAVVMAVAEGSEVGEMPLDVELPATLKLTA